MKKPLKVARDVIEDERTGKKRDASYRDVKYDEDMWADPKHFLPADFDLVYLKTKDRTYNGWAVGNGWDGLNIKDDINVLFWKRQEV